MALEKIRPGVVDDTQNFVFNNVTATGNLTASNANLGNLALANYVTGTLTTSAQPNITSVGTLGNLTVTSNATVGNLLTNNLLYANGSPWQFGGGNGANVAGSNTQVQFNDGGTFGASANFTFDKTTNTLSVTNFTGSGSGLSSLTGANVSGQVANALVAGTVYTAAQPNITSVGTLTSLAVTGNLSSGNANLGNLAVANFFSGAGNQLSNIQGSNVSGQVSYAAVANSVAGANVTGAVTYAATANAVAGGNVLGQVGNALVAGTVYTAAQPNITSVGTLTGLTSNGTINFTGASNVSLGAVGNVKITGGSNGQYLTTDGAGNLSFAAVSSISNGTSNVNIPAANGNVTIGVAGTPNVVVVSPTGIVVTGNITGGSGDGGSITGANLLSANYLAGTLTTASQPNITSLGTLSTLTVSGNITSGNANLGNLVIANFFQGTLTTSAQPNVTSLGNLVGLAVSNSSGIVNFSNTANVTLGNVSNLHISGGSANYVLQTDGAGNLSWVAQTGGGGGGTANALNANIANVIITGGSNGQYLTTDGTGNLSWTTGSASTGNSNITVDTFTANGSQTVFTLSVTPLSINYTLLNIDGVSQLKEAYSLSNANITLDSAPVNGAIVEVTTFTLAGGGSGSSGTYVTRNYTGNGVQTTFTVTSGVTVDSVLVTENGILQTPTTDYTVSGANLTFTTAPANSIAIQIRELAAGGGGGGTSGASNARVFGYSLVFGL